MTQPSEATKEISKEAPKGIKLIAVDLDGTLLNSQHQLSERNRVALKEALNLGVQVMVATGKTYASIAWLYQQLGLTTPGVFGQGTVVHNADGSVRHQQSLPVPILRRVIPFVESRGFAVVVYSGQRLLIKSKDARVDLLAKYQEPAPEVVGSLSNILGVVPFNKLIVIGNDPRSVKGLYWQLDKMMDGQVALTYAGIPTQFEILPLNISKGKTVIAMAKELGIPSDRVMTIGDAENDMDMLQFGLSVAMGNASDKVKNIAKFTVGSNDMDGVAEAIERFVLPPKPTPATPVTTTPATTSEGDAPKPEDMPISKDSN
jgi:Cof subfamily protein (haloacid dehalogenase superfamily)